MNITGVTIYYKLGGVASIIEVDGARYAGDTLEVGAVENLTAWRAQLERCADWTPDGGGNWRRLSPAQARALLLDKVAGYLAQDGGAALQAATRRGLLDERENHA